MLRWNTRQGEEKPCGICPNSLSSHKIGDTVDRLCVKDNLCFKDNCLTVCGMVKLNSV